MRTSAHGVKLITEFEGFRGTAYKDVVGVWTIGFGFTRGVKAGDTITKAKATVRLRTELEEYEAGVLNACTVPPNQNQFDAMVSCAFNIGVAAFRGSSILRAHNRHDFNAAARAFGLWNKAGGKVWPGLVRRRAAEAALYLTPVADDAFAPLEMPQQVDLERPMTASNINRASVVAGGTATLAAVTQTLDAVQGVKNGVDGLGSWLVPAALVLVSAVCAYLIWERFQQRKRGDA